MTFGMCCGLYLVPDLKKSGFDFAELRLKEISALNEDEFKTACDLIKTEGLESKCCNSFFPDSFRLTGDVDFEKIKEYTDLALERAKKLGCEVAVLGCGRARNVPPGFTKEQTLSQFMQVAGICGDIAKKHNIKIAIEPLNTEETDIVNTVQDGIDFCSTLNHSNVGLVVDFFHVFKNNENINNVKNIGDKLYHVHIARPNADRGAPKAEDRETLQKWADFLHKNGYNGTVSLEIRKSANVSDDLASISLLKEIF